MLMHNFENRRGENPNRHSTISKKVFLGGVAATLSTITSIIVCGIWSKLDKDEKDEILGGAWKMVSGEGTKTRDLAGSDGPWYEQTDYNNPESVRMLTECFQVSDTHFQFKLQEPPAGLRWSYTDLNGQTHKLKHGEGITEYYPRTNDIQEVVIWLSGPEETLGTVNGIEDIRGLLSDKQYASAKCVIEIPPVSDQSKAKASSNEIAAVNR